MKILMYLITFYLNMKIRQSVITNFVVSSSPFHVIGFCTNGMVLQTVSEIQYSNVCAFMSAFTTIPMVVDKNHLRSWLSDRDRIPPCWLLSKELPTWFHHDGPPTWMYQKSASPTWMTGDIIPKVITNTYATGRPPM